jgi:heme O synthase-like polyprenyltransferase
MMGAMILVARLCLALILVVASTVLAAAIFLSVVERHWGEWYVSPVAAMVVVTAFWLDRILYAEVLKRKAQRIEGPRGFEVVSARTGTEKP